MRLNITDSSIMPNKEYGFIPQKYFKIPIKLLLANNISNKISINYFVGLELIKSQTDINAYSYKESEIEKENYNFKYEIYRLHDHDYLLNALFGIKLNYKLYKKFQLGISTGISYGLTNGFSYTYLFKYVYYNSSNSSAIGKGASFNKFDSILFNLSIKYKLNKEKKNNKSKRNIN